MPLYRLLPSPLEFVPEIDKDGNIIYKNGKLSLVVSERWKKVEKNRQRLETFYFSFCVLYGVIMIIGTIIIGLKIGNLYLYLLYFIINNN